MQQKFLWLSQLDKMENPMRNLIDVMKNTVSNMGAAQYREVLAELNKAEEAIHNAVRKATDISYELEK